MSFKVFQKPVISCVLEQMKWEGEGVGYLFKGLKPNFAAINIHWFGVTGRPLSADWSDKYLEFAPTFQHPKNERCKKKK